MKYLTKNKYKLALLLIVGIFTSINVMAQQPNHTFNYQGELVDNGSPANGSYDVTVSAFFGSSGGTLQGVVSTHLAVDVNNGLFNLNNVDIGADTFDGLTFFLEIAVRPADSGPYTILAPRQLLQAVPYANDITRKGASSGQVLSFDGNSWEPADPSAASPWTVTGTDVSYLGGRVGIGTTSPSGARLHINTNGVENALRVQVGGVTKLFVRNDGGVAIGGSSSNIAPPDGLSVDGDTVMKGKLTTPTSGDADMKAYVYGHAFSTGVLVSPRSSGGFTVTKTSTGLYHVAFTDTTIDTNYMVVATTNSSSPKFTTVVIGTDAFDVHVWTTAGVHSNHSFQFVVYRK